MGNHLSKAYRRVPTLETSVRLLIDEIWNSLDKNEKEQLFRLITKSQIDIALPDLSTRSIHAFISPDATLEQFNEQRAVAQASTIRNQSPSTIAPSPWCTDSLRQQSPSEQGVVIERHLSHDVESATESRPSDSISETEKEVCGNTYALDKYFVDSSEIQCILDLERTESFITQGIGHNSDESDEDDMLGLAQTCDEDVLYNIIRRRFLYSGLYALQVWIKTEHNCLLKDAKKLICERAAARQKTARTRSCRTPTSSAHNETSTICRNINKYLQHGSKYFRLQDDTSPSVLLRLAENESFYTQRLPLNGPVRKQFVEFAKAKLGPEEEPNSEQIEEVAQHLSGCALQKWKYWFNPSLKRNMTQINERSAKRQRTERENTSVERDPISASPHLGNTAPCVDRTNNLVRQSSLTNIPSLQVLSQNNPVTTASPQVSASHTTESQLQPIVAHTNDGQRLTPPAITLPIPGGLSYCNGLDPGNISVADDCFRAEDLDGNVVDMEFSLMLSRMIDEGIAQLSANPQVMDMNFDSMMQAVQSATDLDLNFSANPQTSSNFDGETQNNRSEELTLA